jgi:hypothetical protein
MTDVAAPERRTGILGQPQVLIGGKWLDADGPGVMEAYAKAVDAANSAQATTGRASSPPRAAKPVVVPPAASAAPTRRGASTGPTARQREVWAAVQEHGTQGAAARALGVNQSSVQSGLQGYMKAMGIDGPMPGYMPKKAPKPKPDTKAREPRASAVAKPAHKVSTESQEPAPADVGEWMHEYAREPEPVAKPGAKYASDMHQDADQPTPKSWRDDVQTDGYLVIAIDATIPAAEMATWDPERIRSFFNGIAAVERALRDETSQ